MPHWWSCTGSGRSTWMNKKEGSRNEDNRKDCVAVFFLVPFGIILYYSVTFGVTGRFVGLLNYADVLGSSAFRLTVGNTLRFLGLVCWRIRG